eukprot:scaffold83745_cov54-Phaeocystis_antarctica.AAC.1
MFPGYHPIQGGHRLMFPGYHPIQGGHRLMFPGYHPTQGGHRLMFPGYHPIQGGHRQGGLRSGAIAGRRQAAPAEPAMPGHDAAASP